MRARKGGGGARCQQRSSVHGGASRGRAVHDEEAASLVPACFCAGIGEAREGVELCVFLPVLGGGLSRVSTCGCAPWAGWLMTYGVSQGDEQPSHRGDLERFGHVGRV